MKPDAWLIVKITGEGEVIHKVVMGWSGGYLHGNSWRVNSGIKGVEYENGFYKFLGFSGSVYDCHENAYGQKVCNSLGLQQIIRACELSNSEYEILDEDTDWLNYTYSQNEGKNLNPSHISLPVFDRKVDALPNDKCAIEIFNDGEWLACEWNPRTTDSQADVGYIGTARTTDSPIQIGLHAWEQNDSEFRYFCLPANDRINHG